MQLEAGGVQRSGNARALRGLTFDMSGGRKQAKPAGGRPLDGRVGPRRGWVRPWEHAANTSRDKTARTLPSTGRRIHAQSVRADGFRLTVARCSKRIHISSQPFRPNGVLAAAGRTARERATASEDLDEEIAAAKDSIRPPAGRRRTDSPACIYLHRCWHVPTLALLGPNVRHERRRKGREAAFGTSAR